MPRIILETLTGKQLAAFALVMLAAQITFFFIGLKAPSPTIARSYTASTCKTKDEGKLKQWYDQGHCQEVDFEHAPKGINANKIVFTVRFPYHKDIQLSRWNQYILVLMNADFKYDKSRKMGNDSKLSYNVQVGYKDDLKTPWNLIANADETRAVSCNILKSETGPHGYDCDYFPLFSIGSCYHKYYLINVKLLTHHDMNSEIAFISGLTFVGIVQEGAFTEVWLIIKTINMLFIIPIVVKFRLNMYKYRQPQLFERTLYALGLSTIMVDLPIEWLTLWFNIPQMVLINDIQTGIFNMMLFTFWAIFVGEHSMDQGRRNNLKSYWKQLLIIILSCLSMLIFDLCERGVQLTNPFHSIWSTKGGRQVAYGFIIAAAICICLYLVCLVAMIIRVLKAIQNRQAAMPHMQQARRVFYEGLIYRFRFQLLFSIICAILTVAFVIINSLSYFKKEYEYEYEQQDESGEQISITGAFLTGIFGLWNIYVFATTFMYCPSSKREDESDQELNTLQEEAQYSVIYKESGKESYN